MAWGSEPITIGATGAVPTGTEPGATPYVPWMVQKPKPAPATAVAPPQQPSSKNAAYYANTPGGGVTSPYFVKDAQGNSYNPFISSYQAGQNPYTGQSFNPPPAIPNTTGGSGGGSGGGMGGLGGLLSNPAIASLLSNQPYQNAMQGGMDYASALFPQNFPYSSSPAFNDLSRSSQQALQKQYGYGRQANMDQTNLLQQRNYATQVPGFQLQQLLSLLGLENRYGDVDNAFYRNDVQGGTQGINFLLRLLGGLF